MDIGTAMPMLCQPESAGPTFVCTRDAHRSPSHAGLPVERPSHRTVARWRGSMYPTRGRYVGAVTFASADHASTEGLRVDPWGVCHTHAACQARKFSLATRVLCRPCQLGDATHKILLFVYSPSDPLRPFVCCSNCPARRAVLGRACMARTERASLQRTGGRPETSETLFSACFRGSTRPRCGAPPPVRPGTRTADARRPGTAPVRCETPAAGFPGHGRPMSARIDHRLEGGWVSAR